MRWVETGMGEGLTNEQTEHREEGGAQRER